ncbi:MAG: hypothetical protein H6966_10330 [Chromatiaceae bacterium]|nr:hypothetical protein [Chromatiaceae bacterium]
MTLTQADDVSHRALCEQLQHPLSIYEELLQESLLSLRPNGSTACAMAPAGIAQRHGTVHGQRLR